jgi:hypothetical protein
MHLKHTFRARGGHGRSVRPGGRTVIEWETELRQADSIEDGKSLKLRTREEHEVAENQDKVKKTTEKIRSAL